MSQQQGAPYKAWAAAYVQLGWSPIPLMIRTKFPVPKEYTGADGAYVVEDDLRNWLHPKARVHVGNLVYPPGNVALRLPKNVIGVDVDAYEGKAGAATLGAAEAAWGKLPPTWATSSRVGSPVSGLRLFQLPEHGLNLSWPGELPQGKGVELIRWDHRYAMVAPSYHDKAPHARYFWRTPEGEIVYLHDLEPEDEVELPAPEDLEFFPDAWIEGLTQGRSYVAGQTAGGRNNAVGEGGELPEDEVKAWITGRDASAERAALAGAYSNGMCSVLAKTLNKWLVAVRGAEAEGGAHDAARNGAWALLGDAQAGHYGISEALGRLRAAFAESVHNRRGKGVAAQRIIKQEWWRIIARGVTKVAAEGEPADHDACSGARKGSAGSGGKRGKEPSSRPAQVVNEFPSNDKGSALRLMQHIGDNARWVPALGGWFRWAPDEGRWTLDVGGNWIQGQVFAMEAELRAELYEMQMAYEEGAGEVKKADLERFAKYVHSLGNVNKVRSATDGVKLLPGMYVSAEQFDTNPRYLLCSNGVAVLGGRLSTPLPAPGSDGDVVPEADAPSIPRGLSFRPADRDDYMSLTTGYPYDPEATHPMWDEFLKRAVPDRDQLHWLQKAVGYSLLGANPERLFFVIIGKTSSGKSTFLEAIRHALGGYSGTFDLNLFKAQKEQGPNVQKVRMMSKRFIVASEASENRILHADEIKSAVGGEAQSARLNNSNDMVTRIPAYTPWLGTNDPPRIPGADQALWRRMWAVPFEQAIPKEKEDPEYAMRLREQAAPAVLAWCLRGWDLYAQEGLSEVPASVAEITMKMRGELDDLDLWLGDMTVPAGPESFVATNDLWSDYQTWCDENNVQPGSKIGFSRGLGRRGYCSDRQRDGGSNPINGWVGLRLNSRS